jgi:ATP-dependent DNA helicase RecQ
VFNDATLQEMTTVLPRDEQGLLGINGIGRHKLKRYGSIFLDEIRAFLVKNMAK